MKMKLEEARGSYYYNSGKLSDINRQACFAGIAVIWIFVAVASSDEIKISESLLPPLILFVVSLALDLVQYLVATVIWSFYSWREEKECVKNEDDVEPPEWFNWTPLVFFYGKAIATVIAFGVLFSHLSKTITCA